MAVPQITNIDKPFGKLKADMLALEEDVLKANKGNRAAATRVRKGMQALKVQAQDIRIALVPSK
ncbi:histone H1 [Hymenobacter sp. RP-2-7]|uniref:Histone H1 n=1 Tax=Hymenobacter polaris TaxID=2682546 RepID=A0A7Y0FP26_9BACT|nr:histone H1 [Hymenobacter polaris]NML67602.1 histone H1 [Hymenobacter polaris]